MSYTYKATATMTIDLNIEAESYAVAEELVNQYLAPVSDNSKVDVISNDGITIDDIFSDDDPEEEPNSA